MIVDHHSIPTFGTSHAFIGANLAFYAQLCRKRQWYYMLLFISLVGEQRDSHQTVPAQSLLE